MICFSLLSSIGEHEYRNPSAGLEPRLDSDSSKRPSNSIFSKCDRRLAELFLMIDSIRMYIQEKREKARESSIPVYVREMGTERKIAVCVRRESTFLPICVCCGYAACRC